jgi:hypothetical protein
LARETESTGVKSPSVPLRKSQIPHDLPGVEPEPPVGKPASNRLNYATALHKDTGEIFTPSAQVWPEQIARLQDVHNRLHQHVTFINPSFQSSYIF